MARPERKEFVNLAIKILKETLSGIDSTGKMKAGLGMHYM